MASKVGDLTVQYKRGDIGIQPLVSSLIDFSLLDRRGLSLDETTSLVTVAFCRHISACHDIWPVIQEKRKTTTANQMKYK